MVTLRMLSIGVALCAITLSPFPVRAVEPPAKEPPAMAPPDADVASGPTIAVADFSGQDKEFGRFMADTLLTDLAQSDRLHLVERSEIRQALTELKLQSTGLVEPQQVKKIGKMLGADRLIVGSYLVRDNQLIINARLLDVRTGKVTPGDAANVTGTREAMLPLVHRLAHLLHKRVTGGDFSLANEGDDAPPPDNPAPDAHDAPAPPAHQPQDADPGPAPDDSPAPSAGLSNVAYGLPNVTVTEQDLANVTRQLGGLAGTHFFVVQHPSAPVTRIRALAALVKVLAPTPLPVAYRSVPNSRLTADAGTLPLWGRLYLASAIEHGLWSAQRPISATAPATWEFVRVIVSRAPQRRSAPVLAVQTHEEVGHHASPAADEDEIGRHGGYTGLVIDAHDMPVQRAMSVRVLDEDGHVLYPDLDHLPDMDYLQDNGLASYHYDGRNLERAGHKPLFIRALRVSGDDFVVSNDVADRILAENRRSKFLWKWHVCILQDEGQ